MLKKTFIALLIILCSAIGIFVIKETVLFDGQNPYGAKELPSDFVAAVPVAAPSRIEDFTSSPAFPVLEAEQKRMAVEFITSELGRSGSDVSQAHVVDVKTETESRIFTIASAEGIVLAKVRLDRLGRFSLESQN